MTSNFIYLCFNIQNAFIMKVGEVQLRMHKFDDFEKIRNPELAADEAIETFKQQHPQFVCDNLRAFYTGDLIPNDN